MLEFLKNCPENPSHWLSNLRDVICPKLIKHMHIGCLDCSLVYFVYEKSAVINNHFM